MTSSHSNAKLGSSLGQDIYIFSFSLISYLLQLIVNLCHKIILQKLHQKQEIFSYNEEKERRKKHDGGNGLHKTIFLPLIETVKFHKEFFYPNLQKDFCVICYNHYIDYSRNPELESSVICYKHIFLSCSFHVVSSILKAKE